MTIIGPFRDMLVGIQGYPFLLASSSPRRMQLLSSLGITFETVSVSVDESIEPGESAEAACVRLAREKARAATTDFDTAWILGADTLVVVDDVILGKPRDDEEGLQMLRRLSGRSHEVWTGLAIRRIRDGGIVSAAERTRVWFDELSEDAIKTLAADGRDKAGAYGIQGLAGFFIGRIEGDYYNVMGLPLARLRRLCLEAS